MHKTYGMNDTRAFDFFASSKLSNVSYLSLISGSSVGNPVSQLIIEIFKRNGIDIN